MQREYFTNKNYRRYPSMAWPELEPGPPKLLHLERQRKRLFNNRTLYFLFSVIKFLKLRYDKGANYQFAEKSNICPILFHVLIKGVKCKDSKRRKQ